MLQEIREILAWPFYVVSWLIGVTGMLIDGSAFDVDAE